MPNRDDLTLLRAKSGWAPTSWSSEYVCNAKGMWYAYDEFMELEEDKLITTFNGNGDTLRYTELDMNVQRSIVQEYQKKDFGFFLLLPNHLSSFEYSPVCRVDCMRWLPHSAVLTAYNSDSISYLLFCLTCSVVTCFLWAILYTRVEWFNHGADHH
jgi:hypothetical protein